MNPLVATADAAAPLVASSIDTDSVDMPAIETAPLAATESGTDTTSVAVGLAMSQTPSVTQVSAASPLLPTGTESDAADIAVAEPLAMVDAASPTAADEDDAFEAWDTDLDSILTDLTGDLRKRVLV